MRIILTLLSICLSTLLMAQPAKFRHPGLLHSAADIARMKQRIADGEEAAVQSLANLRTSYAVRGDHGHGWAVNETIIRGIAGENYINSDRNASRAYQMALLWQLTGDVGAANEAIGILNNYALWNKSLWGNSNISLIPAFTGYQFLNAAELMRDYDGWQPADLERFKQYMIDVWFTVAQDFLERRHDTVTREGNWFHYYSNWGVGCELFCISLGIFCDSPDVYNYGMYWLTEGPGNESLFVGQHPDARADLMCGQGWGLIPWFHADSRAPLGYFGQMQENGRDQGHSLASLGILGNALETCFKQDYNLYCNLYNPQLSGMAGSAIVAGAAEYVAAYNTGVDDLPFRQNWWMEGFNANSRGQWRPIWQQFINAYENRMGIAMPYSHAAHDAMGLEWGAGDYGTGSGSFDHIGWGDLCCNDEKVAEGMAPTVLFPEITVGSDATRHAGWASKIAKGTSVRLTASLPSGEQNSGNWVWNDGATGQTRTVTPNTSGLYTVTYTNANGVKSSQSFCLSVYGEGITGTLSHHLVNRHAESDLTADATIKAGRNKTATLTSSYTNWNYVESEKWFENGQEIASGYMLNYTQNDDQTHTILYRLTTESGATIERTFTFQPEENDLTLQLADPYCADPTKWNCTGTPTMSIAPDFSRPDGLSQPFIEAYRAGEQDGQKGWGLQPFNISGKQMNLAPGKYRLMANVIATQQTATEQAQRDIVGGFYLYAGGVLTPVASLDAKAELQSVDFYVGEDGTFTYGVKNVSNQDYANSLMGANWFAMDNYELYALGNADLAADLADYTTRAEAIAETDVPANIYNKVQLALQQTGSEANRIVALQAAVSEAEAAAQWYRYFKLEVDALRSALAESSYSNAALTAAIQAFDEASTLEEMHARHDAVLASWKAQMADIAVTQDVSFLVNNMNLARLSSVMYDNAIHWKTEALTGNMRVFDYNGIRSVERFCDGYYAAGERALYQTLTGLPTGYYTFTADALQGNEGGQIAFYAKGDTEQRVNLQGAEKLSSYLCGAYVSGGTLDLGLLTLEGNATNWTLLQNMKLTYATPRALLTELWQKGDSIMTVGDGSDALQSLLAQAKGDLDNPSTADTRLVEHIEALRQLFDELEASRLVPEDNGWQRVTTLADMQAAVDAGYVFLFRDSHDLMLDLVSVGGGRYKMAYAEVADPAMVPTMVWTIEMGSADGKLGIRNVTQSQLMMQTEFNEAFTINTHDQPLPISWADFNFALDDDGSWTVENGTYGGNFFGPWDPRFEAGQHLAGNKTGDLVSHFDLYAMSRADYDKLYLRRNSQDLTQFLANPSFETGNTWGWTTDVNTWWTAVKTSAAGDPQATDGSYIFGVWDGAVGKNALISQDITLPAGTYCLKVDMQAPNGTDNYPRLGDQHLFCGETKAYFRDHIETNGAGDEYPMQTVTLIFTVDEDNTTLCLGANQTTAPNQTWYKIDNFRLTAVTDKVQLTDNEAITAYTAATYDKIWIQRTLKQGWNTLCLPFGTTATEVAGEGALAYEFVSVSANNELSFDLVNEMKANVPYLFYSEKEAVIPNFTNLYVATLEARSVTVGDWKFIGNYAPGMDMNGKYGITGDKVRKAGSGSKLNGMRAYFEGPAGAQATVRVQNNTNVDTSVKKPTEAIKVIGYYTLDGKRLASPVKGVNLVRYSDMTTRKIVVK